MNLDIQGELKTPRAGEAIRLFYFKKFGVSKRRSGGFFETLEISEPLLLLELASSEEK